MAIPRFLIRTRGGRIADAGLKPAMLLDTATGFEHPRQH